MKARQILKTLVLIILLLSAISVLSGLMEMKDGNRKFKPFLEEKNNFDVLFLGSSHVLNGILPLELWNEQGIVSYNMGYHGIYPSEAYWVLKNALLKTSPKLVVIDGYYLSCNTKYQSVEDVHKGIDPFPLSVQKAEAIWDLMSGQNQADWKDVFPYLFNFALYHERWNDFNSGDFSEDNNKEKGAERRVGVYSYAPWSRDDAEPADCETIQVTYVNKIIETCREAGIDVLLLYLPTYHNSKTVAESRRMNQIAEENQANYLNLFDMEGINPAIDFYDNEGHLNPAGAVKVTRRLGEYIVQNYDIPDHRSDEAYYDWYDDYDAYIASAALQLPGISRLPVYLMMLSAGNYDAVLEISDPDLWQNEMFRQQVGQLGVDMNSVTENTDLIAVSDGGWDATVCDFFNDQQQLGSDPDPTVLGDIQKEWTDDGRIVLRLNGNVLYSIENMSDMSACPLKIMVMDRTTKQLIDAACFDNPEETDTVKLNMNKAYSIL